VGSYYANLTLKGPSQEQVLAYLAESTRNAYVSPTVGDCTVVYDQQVEQDPAALAAAADELSRALECVALAVLNQNDDVLFYELYRAGEWVDEYNSTPGYFAGDGDASAEGGDAEKLCTAFDLPDAAADAAAILHGDDYPAATDRHAALAALLGLPPFCAGTGYTDLEGGQYHDELDPDLLVKSPA